MHGGGKNRMNKVVCIQTKLHKEMGREYSNAPTQEHQSTKKKVDPKV